MTCTIGLPDSVPATRNKIMTTVLIIDDDEDVREALSTALQLENFETLEAPHGDYGLRLLEKHEVDVVVTDIFMPEKEGLETIVDAKQRWPELRIIAISGGPGATRRMGVDGGHDFLPVAKDLGADRVMKKPFLPSELIQVIGELLAERDGGDGDAA